ncbi:chromosome segregation in meiosis- protein [Microbotryomycetes sp. JL201]|nr:chromosome segregation in meiosis- protein [Microbotryomycetes sp. JL201]
MSSTDSEDADVAAVAAKRAQLSRPLFNAADVWSEDEPVLAAQRVRPRRVAHFLGADDDDDDVQLDGGEDMLADLFGDLRDVTDGGAREAGTAAGHVSARGADVTPLLDGNDVDAVVKKIRKPTAKMDEFRLLSASGFPALLRDIQRFKPKGKGHERSDLKRVITMYQLWSHQMFPRTNIRDTLRTVERLCHKNSVKRSLKEWRDEAKTGKRKNKAISQDSADHETDFGNVTAGATQRQQQQQQQPQKALEFPDTDAPSPSHEFADMENGDLFADEEELLRELEEQAVTVTAAVTGSHARTEAVRQPTSLGDAADEAEAALRDLEDF